jgi:hypothetical protein
MQAKSQFLIVSRGQWDPDISPEEIQEAIDEFYLWLLRLVDEGKMKTGQRLGIEGRTVSGKGFITDGPFGEAKEVIGGYWSILADNIDEAAKIAAGSPCLKCGLFYEIRPFVFEQATASTVTNETPVEWRKKR